MIEIQKFEKIDKGALVAKFNVKMHKWGGIVIRECTMFEANGKRWLTMPSRQYEIEGKKKYFPYLAFEDRAMHDKFLEAIMKAVDEYIYKLAAAQSVVNVAEDQGEFPF